jgi:hypothetical protein
MTFYALFSHATVAESHLQVIHTFRRHSGLWVLRSPLILHVLPRGKGGMISTMTLRDGEESPQRNFNRPCWTSVPSDKAEQKTWRPWPMHTHNGTNTGRTGVPDATRLTFHSTSLLVGRMPCIRGARFADGSKATARRNGCGFIIPMNGLVCIDLPHAFDRPVMY